MAQSGQRKCLCCKLFFDPDHRNRERQRYCSQAECRRASKIASQAAWLAQSDNHDYFRGPVHLDDFGSGFSSFAQLNLKTAVTRPPEAREAG